MCAYVQLVMSKRRVPCLDSYLDKVNLLVWPRFKAVFDLHLSSVKNANVRALWEDDVHAHYVARRYAEFASAMVQLNTEGGDQQVGTCFGATRIGESGLCDLAREHAMLKVHSVCPRLLPQDAVSLHGPMSWCPDGLAWPPCLCGCGRG